MNNKIFISIIFLVLLGAGFFLIQTKNEAQAKVLFQEGEELKIEEEKGKAPEVTLISVYDNYEVNPELKTAWGFGCVVKTSKKFRELGVQKVAPSHCTGDSVKETKLEKISKLSEIKLKSQVIETKAEEEIIHYFQQYFYSEGDFSIILKNKERFESNQIEKFKKELIGVSAENFEFNLDQAEKSVILKCDIKGASYGTNSYSMHFLLGNWPFDLYQFKGYEKKLVYKGKIDKIPTKVVFKFPYSLSHCHEHVWPK